MKSHEQIKGRNNQFQFPQMKTTKFNAHENENQIQKWKTNSNDCWMANEKIVKIVSAQMETKRAKIMWKYSGRQRIGCHLPGMDFLWTTTCFFFKQSFFTFIERYSTKKILWEKIKKHISVLLQHGVTQNITINPHRWWRSAKKWKMEFWMRWKELIRQWWTNYFTKKYCN